ncbi:hypothetical protein KY290_027596 [Solanum tuberosum]|uniref:Uncharacterized protein n=1 Tax=Solanum tuberosum TaxID=4113 RepID=A0ABQ7UFK7_SOLTU|nr:hypothetical protein KY290_027596 [Solanum tuberosum]
MVSSNHQKLLDKCPYAYFVKKGMHEVAAAFANDVDVATPIDDAIESLEGFLVDWWDSFYSMFSFIQAKHAQDPYAKAAQTMDNVVRQIPFIVPSSSSQRAIFVTDFSHQIEQIPNMSQPREARNEAENVEQTMNKEPIVNTLDKAMLPVRDPSKKGLC